MMQLYKKRTYGEVVSDALSFFKSNGKNYFKNYFLINGLLLILMVVLFVLGYREFFTQLMDGNVDGQNYYFQEYFENNLPVLIIVVLSMMALFLIVSVISYSFPVLYLKRYSETGNKNIKADEILGDMKSNLVRFIPLILGMVFIVTPLFFTLFAINILLVFIIIGIFLFFITVPFSMNVVNFTLYDYFNRKGGFFKALSFAISAQFSYPNKREKSPFWKYWGATAIILFINQVVSSVFTGIPMLIFQFALITSPSKTGGFEENPFTGTMGLLFFLIYGISLLVSFVLMNLQMVASGLLYYDNRIDLHQKIELQEIDSIGTHEA